MNQDPMHAALTMTLQEVFSQWVQTRASLIAAEQKIEAQDAEIAHMKAPKAKAA